MSGQVIFLRILGFGYRVIVCFSRLNQVSKLYKDRRYCSLHGRLFNLAINTARIEQSRGRSLLYGPCINQLIVRARKPLGEPPSHMLHSRHRHSREWPVFLCRVFDNTKQFFYWAGSFVCTQSPMKNNNMYRTRTVTKTSQNSTGVPCYVWLLCLRHYMLCYAIDTSSCDQQYFQLHMWNISDLIFNCFKYAVWRYLESSRCTRWLKDTWMTLIRKTGSQRSKNYFVCLPFT